MGTGKGPNTTRQFKLIDDNETIGGIKTAGINHPNDNKNPTLYVVLYTSEQAKILMQKSAFDHYYSLLLGRQYDGINEKDVVENPVVVIAQGVPDGTSIDMDIEAVK